MCYVVYSKKKTAKLEKYKREKLW